MELWRLPNLEGNNVQVPCAFKEALSMLALEEAMVSDLRQRWNRRTTMHTPS